MIYLMIRHKVRDYTQWKLAFDNHAAVRREFGCLSGKLYRSHTDVNDITVVTRWNSAAEAERFVASTELRNAMRAAGVIGDPQIAFLEEAGEFAE